jgi:hypothetical protein
MGIWEKLGLGLLNSQSRSVFSPKDEHRLGYLGWKKIRKPQLVAAVRIRIAACPTLSQRPTLAAARLRAR